MRHGRTSPGLLLLPVLLSCGGGGAVGPDAAKAVYSSLALSPDSVAVVVGGATAVTVGPRDQHGTRMSGLPAATLTVEDPSVATVSGLAVRGEALGATRLFAALTVDGVIHGDTSRIVVTAAPTGGPAHPVRTVGSSFVPSSLTVGVGDSVSWVFTGAVHNVTFLGSNRPADGNVPNTSSATVSRTFTGPGVYSYECTIHSGMTGEVIVQSGQTQVFTAVALTPDAASLLMGDTLRLTATALDQNGVPITGLPAASFITSNAAVAVVSPAGLVQAVSAGVDTITGSITSGGITHAATTVISVSPPLAGAGVTTPNLTFEPATVTIQVGQGVTWQFSGATHNVTWLPGPVPAGGDIPDQAVGSTVQRSFPAPGVYSYECTRHNNMTGAVVVQSGQAQVFSSVSVVPATATLLIGGSAQLVATPLDQSGVPMTGLPAPTSPAATRRWPRSARRAGDRGRRRHRPTSPRPLPAAPPPMWPQRPSLVTAPAPGGVTVTTTDNNTFSPERQPRGGGHRDLAVLRQHPQRDLDRGRSRRVAASRTSPRARSRAASPPRAITAIVCTRHNGMTGTVTVTRRGRAAVYTTLQLSPQAPLSRWAGPCSSSRRRWIRMAPRWPVCRWPRLTADATVATVSLTGW